VSPFPRLDDTIVAVATPPGRSGIGIVRLSGSSARNIAEIFFESSAPFQNRLARFGVFREPPSKSSIDQVVNALRSVNLFDLEVEVLKEGLFDGQQKDGLGNPKRYDGESTMMKVKALFESPG